MARLRHVAMRTNRQERIAAFYREVFGLTEVFRHASAETGQLAIYLTDGEINLAVIPTGPHPEGLDHIGFAVADLVATAAAALAAGGAHGPTAVPQDGRQNEVYIADPGGQRIDLSSGWHHDATSTSRVTRVTMAGDEAGRRAGFYAQVFDLTRVPSDGDDVTVLSDGEVELVIGAPAAATAPRGSALRGLAFRVDDLAATLTRAAAIGARRGNAAVATPNAPSASLLDPLGQRIDVYQRVGAAAR